MTQTYVLLMTPPAVNTFGITVSLVGVIMLFYFGMPFHVPTGGSVGLGTDETNQDDIAIERRNKLLGYAGLVLVVAGAAAQIIAAWM